MRDRLLITAALFLAVAGAPVQAADVLVFAAASTRQVIADIAREYDGRSGDRIRAVFHSTGGLARQIESGAPAQVFVSANVAWIDHLADRNAVDPATRRTLFRNTLVVVAPRDAAPPGDLSGPADILVRLGADRRLAVADPRHVPAGHYARQALTALGLWQRLEPRAALAQNVRTALALVERGETPLGIVYLTDARQSGQVRVVFAFDPHSHDPIVYQAVRTAEPDVAADRFLAFLASPDAAAIYRRHGFLAD